MKHAFLLGWLGYDGAAPLPTVWLDDRAQRDADALLQPFGAKPLVVVAPFGRAIKRLWPLPNYAALIEAIKNRTECNICILAGETNPAPIDALLPLLDDRTVMSAGSLDIMGAAAVIGRARLFIGADSAPAHIASAVDVPTVQISCHPVTGAIDHPNSPITCGPLKSTARVFRPARHLSPCTNGCRIGSRPHCITQISAAEVIDTVTRFLSADARA